MKRDRLREAAQPKYILRQPRTAGARALCQAEHIIVRYGMHTRVLKTEHVPGIGPVEHVEETRPNRNYVTITPTTEGGGLVLDALGTSVSGGLGRSTWADLKLKSVKAAIRRLRPQEAKLLDYLDDEIADVAKLLTALRTSRAAALERAWKRANVVRVKELDEMAEDKGADTPPVTS